MKRDVQDELPGQKTKPSSCEYATKCWELFTPEQIKTSVKQVNFMSSMVAINKGGTLQ